MNNSFEKKDSNWEIGYDRHTYLAALDLVEIFNNLFLTGQYGQDREAAMEHFLNERGYGNAQSNNENV